MPSFNVARLDKKISEDIPDINTVLKALAKWDVSSFTDIPDGSLRMTLDVKNQGTIEKYSGSWTPVTKLMHDVDKLDGYHASTSASANTIVVRDKNGAIPGNILGNAATATEAGGLSNGVTLSVSQGGTGATTASQALANLGGAPAFHASNMSNYGIGSSTLYGHVKLSDATDISSGVDGGTASTPAATKDAKDTAVSAGRAASAAQRTADAAGTAAGTAQQTADAAVSAADKAQQTADSAMAKAEEAASKAGLPLGHFYAHPYPTPIEGSLHCNGGLNSRELYADLFAFAQANKQVITEQEWQATAEACGGYCSYYSDGDGTSTFRMPKFAPHIQIALIAASAGTYHKPGLPNIEAGWTTGWNDAYIPTIQTSGAVKTISNSAYSMRYNVGSQTSNPWRVNFNASLFDSIYGSSTTVQPESQEWIICVVAFGKATNVGEVDVANVMSAIAQVQEDLMNKTTPAQVAEYGAPDYSRIVRISLNGSFGYQVPADGFIKADVAFGSGYAYLYIHARDSQGAEDTSMKYIWGASSSNGGIYAGTVPVKKGVFVGTQSGNTSNTNTYFIPAKGADWNV